jgi:putative polyhydroxyalkanoate system protein
MSHIDIRRHHTLSLPKAREAAELIAAQLDDKFNLKYHWNENTLHFERHGVNGRMEVDADEIRLHVRLGFLLSPLRYRFEKEIHRYMDELLEG